MSSLLLPGVYKEEFLLKTKAVMQNMSIHELQMIAISLQMKTEGLSKIDLIHAILDLVEHRADSFHVGSVIHTSAVGASFLFLGVILEPVLSWLVTQIASPYHGFDKYVAGAFKTMNRPVNMSIVSFIGSIFSVLHQNPLPLTPTIPLLIYNTLRFGMLFFGSYKLLKAAYQAFTIHSRSLSENNRIHYLRKKMIILIEKLQREDDSMSPQDCARFGYLKCGTASSPGCKWNYLQRKCTDTEEVRLLREFRESKKSKKSKNSGGRPLVSSRRRSNLGSKRRSRNPSNKARKTSRTKYGAKSRSRKGKRQGR